MGDVALSDSRRFRRSTGLQGGYKCSAGMSVDRDTSRRLELALL
jgi:hypothetical protein